MAAKHLSAADIVRYLDDEVSPLEAEAMREHLALCFACRAQAANAEAMLNRVDELYAANLGGSETSRMHLQQKLAHIAPARAWWRQPAFAAAALVLLVAGLGFYGLRIKASHAPVGLSASRTRSLPNHSLTPGSIRPVSLSDLCPTGDDDLDPAVPDATRRAVLEEYGIVSAGPGTSYQIDYLVNPQLGGTNDIRNLWPQPYQDAVWNAQAKDELEKRLHQMVCDHTVDLTVAQQEIETDWIAAYKKYIPQRSPG